jgi:hypothetical protein
LELNKEHKVASLVGNKLVYQHPIALQKYDFDGKLYMVNSNQVKLMVTDNHRMYVRTRYEGYKAVEAREIFNKTRFYKKNVDVWEPDFELPQEFCIENGVVSKFIIPSIEHNGKILEPLKLDMDSWLSFFGIWLAEGCSTLEIGYGVRFAANKQRVKDALTSACLKLGFDIVKVSEHSWRINNAIQVTHYIQNMNQKSVNKILPHWVWYLNRDQCRKLIFAMCLGDGHTMENGTVRYDTSSTKLADDFQRLCLHAGWSSNKILKYEAGHESVKKDGYVIKSNYDAYRLTINTSQNEPIVNKHRPDKHKFDSMVDYKGNVYCCTVPEGEGILYVRREGYPVWCGNSSHGQKGVIGCIMDDADMPFTKDGHRIDLIINPHAIPSRMTIGHLLETMMAKYAVCEGIILDGTPFNGNDYEWIQNELEAKYNFERYGNEVMYNGRTGEQIETEIFIGPIMYQRLKHMVSDKINYRSTGPRQATTRQPVKGRSNNGGLRIGEMERDSLLSHGMMAFIKESMMERADNYECDIEKSTGDIAITNSKSGTFKPQNDDGRFFSTIKVPYAFKLLTQEIKGLGVKPYISTETLSDDEGADDAEAEILLHNMSESDDDI